MHRCLIAPLDVQNEERDIEEPKGDYSLTMFNTHRDSTDIQKMNMPTTIWIQWSCRPGKKAPLLLVSNTLYTELEVMCIFLSTVIGLLGIAMTAFVISSTPKNIHQ